MYAKCSGSSKAFRTTFPKLTLEEKVVSDLFKHETAGLMENRGLMRA